MSVDTTATYRALYNPQTDARTWTPPVDLALTLAHEALDERATTNIHDDNAVLRAAVHLEMRLRDLVTALDKEAGR